MRIRLALLCLLIVSGTVLAAAERQMRLEGLKKGDAVSGFSTEAIYLGDRGQPIGGRFIHQRSGFTLDYLQIESVPQGYTWVNSIPVGDQGEPHTQEHLLLGKGTVGRAFAGLDTMWLSGSSAFTQQWRTSYHFNTTAGKDVFFDLFAAELNALLHPNYSDEEIRREVRSFGVTENADGSLRLEEKGSVYNEMTSSSANRYRVLFRSVAHLVYGPEHPLAYNSGGEPAGIRTMQPEDIRKFHAANYYLANMGTMVAVPQSVPLSEVLARTDAILRTVEKEPKERESTTEVPFPPPQPSEPGSIAIAEYPHRNDQQPSPVAFAWPANRGELSADEIFLLELFARTFAGDATTNLYKLFVDSRTRVMETGATGAFANVSRDPGHPLAFVLDNVTAANLTTERLEEMRHVIVGELARIAAFADGSDDLKELNARIASRLVESERWLANFVNTPPAWGARGTYSSWMDQLLLLERTPEFRKSLTFAPQIAGVRKLLQSETNIWRDRLAIWNLVGVTPYVAAARPSPSLLQREERERLARAETEARRIAAAYGLDDIQEALKRYRREQDEAAAIIEEEARGVTPPSFVANPPMTLDDDLKFSRAKLGSGVPIVASNFENMSSATVGLALDATSVPREQLRYLSLLPALLTRVGVIEEGKPVSFEEMSERLRQEILRLDAYFSTNERTGRVELMVRASGLGSVEAKRAVHWMSLVLHAPDWRPENLSRIRDLVDQQVSTLRNTMQGPEESWVNNPSTAYRMEMHPVYLAADSFLTRGHNALRLRWLLKEAPADDRNALVQWFTALAQRRGSRAELEALVASTDTLGDLSTSARAIAAEALRDLGLTLIEVPDQTLGADWHYLVTAMRDDLMTPPAQVLRDLNELRGALLRRANARMWLVGSTPIRKSIEPDLNALTSSLSSVAKGARTVAESPLVQSRFLSRYTTPGQSPPRPVYVGLLAPNMQGGVIMTSVPGIHFSDFADRNRQLDYLAGRLHAGAGAHGVFLKTLAAGLAYSNGLRSSVRWGRGGYYAERTPEIPQTVRFVIETLKNAERDPRLSEYAVAQVFGETRAADTYEARAEGIANDLADGQPPDQVRRFRQSILELRKDPKLGETLFDRKDAVYGRWLPGYNVKGADVPGAVYFTIGPERQLGAWEAYLKNVEGDGTSLYRLYPRDFWMP